MTPHTIGNIFTAWSAVLALLFWGAAAYAAVRIIDMLIERPPQQDPDLPRVMMMIAAGAIACAGTAVHQTHATLQWMADAYTAANLHWSTYLYRGLWSVGALGVAATTSYPRCGHKGWASLLGISLFAGIGAYLYDP